jgi:hypothetical protein
MTNNQLDAIARKWEQADEGQSFTEFASSVEPTFGCDGAIAVRWCGMWICIETDGYCHT